MNPKFLVPIAVTIGAVALAAGIFIGRSSAPGPSSMATPEVQKVETPEAVASSAFGKRLARVSPQLEESSVPDAPLKTRKVSKVLRDPMPGFSMAPVAIEKLPANRVEPIGISGPPRSSSPDTYPLSASPSGGQQGLIKLAVAPPVENPQRPVPLAGPPEAGHPSNEDGEILRLERPVRNRAEQGPSYDYPTAEIRTAPASEALETLARFSVKEWSAGRSMSTDRILKTNRIRPALESFTAVPSARSKEIPEPSSKIPDIEPTVQNRPVVTPESLPEVELKDRFSSVRFPTPSPMTKSPPPAPKDVQENVSHSPIQENETFSMKAGAFPFRKSRLPGSLPFQSESLEHLSPDFIPSPLIPIRQSEPLPEMNVLTDWWLFSTFETVFHPAEVKFPLPGIHPPLKPRSSEAPSEGPLHPILPLPPQRLQL